jgi:hypothetical protein
MALKSRKTRKISANDKENEDKVVPASRKPTGSRKSKKLGKLAGLLDMPLDILFEVRTSWH